MWVKVIVPSGVGDRDRPVSCRVATLFGETQLTRRTISTEPTTRMESSLHSEPS